MALLLVVTAGLLASCSPGEPNTRAVNDPPAIQSQPPSVSPPPTVPPENTVIEDEYTGKPDPIVNSNLDIELKGKLPQSAIDNLNGFVSTSLSDSSLLSGQWYQEGNFSRFASYFEGYLAPSLYDSLSDLNYNDPFDNRLVQSVAPVFIANNHSRVPSYCKAEVELSCVNSDVSISLIDFSGVPPTPVEPEENLETPPPPKDFIVTIAGSASRTLYDTEDRAFELNINYTYELTVNIEDGKIHYLNNSYVVSGD